MKGVGDMDFLRRVEMSSGKGSERITGGNLDMGIGVFLLK